VAGLFYRNMLKASASSRLLPDGRLRNGAEFCKASQLIHVALEISWRQAQHSGLGVNYPIVGHRASITSALV
jgi:hypothetical protein